jgi:hypothetical protein
MVAHGAMATATKVENELQHYVPLGSIVMCVDPYGKKRVTHLAIFPNYCLYLTIPIKGFDEVQILLAK